MGWKWEAVKQVEGENPWITYYRNVVTKRNGCINCIITGMPGSGKSWSMLKTAYDYNPDLDLNDCLYFKAGKLMRDIKSKELFRGRLWLYDEAGIDLNNLRYQDAINRGLNAFFQTGRHRNYIYMGTVPFINFISKGVRKLMNVHWKATGVKEGKTQMMPRIMQYNEMKDKFYFKRLHVINQDHATIPCSILGTTKPPTKLIKEYEKRKREFTDSLNDDIVRDIDVFELKRMKKQGIANLTEKQSNILDLLKQGFNGLDISKKFSVSNKYIYEQMQAIKKKGITLISCVNNGKRYYKVDNNGLSIA